MPLPSDRDARNAIPLWDGLFSYFPDVWAEIAKVSVVGNKQHNLGAKLFWNREVSTDHLNKVMRHCFDHGTGNVMDTDDTYHMAKAIWRACAELQLAIEARRALQPKSLDAVWKNVENPKPYKPYSINTELANQQDAAAKKRQESY
jgi:hypothetical protein